MSDTEVIEALEELLELMLHEGDLQRSSTISNTLDLINRKKAEIERLKAENQKLKRDMSYMSSPNTIGNVQEMGCW